MKLNKKFGRLVGDSIEYAPSILNVVTHNHDEWDEEILDPETGEPTGETEHRSRDWDTEKTEMWPTFEDYKKMKWLYILDNYPDEEPPDGTHWEQRGWKEEELAENVKVIKKVYDSVENPPPPTRIFSKMKCVAKLMENGVWEEAKGYIENSGLYDLYVAAQEFREDDKFFKSGKKQLQDALGWTDEQVESLLSECEAS